MIAIDPRRGAPTIAASALLAAAMTWVLQRTQFGNWIFAIGGNPDAARNAGVPVDRVRIILFMGTAVCATLFALLHDWEPNLLKCAARRAQLEELCGVGDIGAIRETVSQMVFQVLWSGASALSVP